MKRSSVIITFFGLALASHCILHSTSAWAKYWSICLCVDVDQMPVSPLGFDSELECTNGKVKSCFDYCLTQQYIIDSDLDLHQYTPFSTPCFSDFTSLFVNAAVISAVMDIKNALLGIKNELVRSLTTDTDNSCLLWLGGAILFVFALSYSVPATIVAGIVKGLAVIVLAIASIFMSTDKSEEKNISLEEDSNITLNITTVTETSRSGTITVPSAFNQSGNTMTFSVNIKEMSATVGNCTVTYNKDKRIVEKSAECNQPSSG